MKKYFFVLASCLFIVSSSIQAFALEYQVDAPDAGLFAAPTSQETILVGVGESANIDRSKNAALIPPTFGSPTSYTLNAGTMLTPNLISTQTVVTAGGGVTVVPPATALNPVSNSIGAYAPIGYTAVTNDLYYSGGHLGTLKIPAIGLTVKVYQGTDSSALAKGAGHFSNTSIWDGNIAIAGHNRGVNNHFGKIHTLSIGDKITFATKLGTRSYKVYSIAKVSVNDLSVLNDSSENLITLVTCVMNEPDYRWCVQAKEV